MAVHTARLQQGICHNLGKHDPGDSLSSQSAKYTLVRKGSVHDVNEVNVRPLRVLEDAAEEKIQEALLKIFRQHACDSV